MGCVSLKVVPRVEVKGRLNSQLVKSFCGNKVVLLGGIRYSVNERLDSVSQG